MSSGWGNDPNPSIPPSGQPAPDQQGFGEPMQPGYPAEPPAGKRPGWLGPAIIGIIAIIVVGGFFLFRDRISNDVGSLEPGQCFDTPSDDTTEVSDVQRQPCNEPHDAEVFANFIHPAPAGEAYPIVSRFTDYVEQNCGPAYVTYTGEQWDQTEFDIGWFEPTMNGWRDGDRDFTCYIYRIDEAKINGSLRRGAGQSP